METIGVMVVDRGDIIGSRLDASTSYQIGYRLTGKGNLSSRSMSYVVGSVCLFRHYLGIGEIGSQMTGSILLDK